MKRYALRSQVTGLYRTVNAKQAAEWLHTMGFNRQGVKNLLNQADYRIVRITGQVETLEAI